MGSRLCIYWQTQIYDVYCSGIYASRVQWLFRFVRRSAPGPCNTKNRLILNDALSAIKDKEKAFWKTRADELTCLNRLSLQRTPTEEIDALHRRYKTRAERASAGRTANTNPGTLQRLLTGQRSARTAGARPPGSLEACLNPRPTQA